MQTLILLDAKKTQETEEHHKMSQEDLDHVLT